MEADGHPLNRVACTTLIKVGGYALRVGMMDGWMDGGGILDGRAQCLRVDGRRDGTMHTPPALTHPTAGCHHTAHHQACAEAKEGERALGVLARMRRQESPRVTLDYLGYLKVRVSCPLLLSLACIHPFIHSRFFSPSLRG